MKDNIVQFPKAEDYAIKIPWNEECLAKFDTLSEFACGLPLTAADNYRLVELMVEATVAAQRCGFENGVRVTVSLAKDGLLDQTEND